VDGARLFHNARAVAGAGDIMAVVKADAYGTERTPVASRGAKCRVVWREEFWCRCLAEAQELRRRNTGRDFTLSPFSPDEAGGLVQNDAPFVPLFEQVAAPCPWGDAPLSGPLCIPPWTPVIRREGLPRRASTLRHQAQALTGVKLWVLPRTFPVRRAKRNRRSGNAVATKRRALRACKKPAR